MSFPTFPTPPRSLTPDEALPKTKAILRAAKLEVDEDGRPRQLTHGECEVIAAEFAKLQHDRREVRSNDEKEVRAVMDYWAAVKEWERDQDEQDKLIAAKAETKKLARSADEEKRKRAADRKVREGSLASSIRKKRNALGIGKLTLGLSLLMALMRGNLRFVIVVPLP